MKPITPAEARQKRLESIPEAVIDAFNACIVEKINGKTAYVEQKEVVAAILSRIPDATSEMVFDKHWLDVEEIFEKVGWHVEYDKPGYNESYEARFIFSVKS